MIFHPLIHPESVVDNALHYEDGHIITIQVVGEVGIHTRTMCAMYCPHRPDQNPLYEFIHWFYTGYVKPKYSTNTEFHCAQRFVLPTLTALDLRNMKDEQET